MGATPLLGHDWSVAGEATYQELQSGLDLLESAIIDANKPLNYTTVQFQARRLASDCCSTSRLRHLGCVLELGQRLGV